MLLQISSLIFNLIILFAFPPKLSSPYFIFLFEMSLINVFHYAKFQLRKLFKTICLMEMKSVPAKNKEKVYIKRNLKTVPLMITSLWHDNVYLAAFGLIRCQKE